MGSEPGQSTSISPTGQWHAHPAPPDPRNIRWDEVTAKLEHIQRMNPDERLDMVAGDGDESQRARKFASKRAAHYDEYKRLQQWRDQRHAGGDEEEENDAG